jgi:hypothetical protein
MLDQIEFCDSYLELLDKVKYSREAFPTAGVEI